MSQMTPRGLGMSLMTRRSPIASMSMLQMIPMEEGQDMTYEWTNTFSDKSGEFKPCCKGFAKIGSAKISTPSYERLHSHSPTISPIMKTRAMRLAAMSLFLAFLLVWSSGLT